MRFFHLSDLHIGKQLHRYNLREDQEAILKEVVAYAKDLRPDHHHHCRRASMTNLYPSAEAVAVFDEFLTSLSGVPRLLPLLIISGNHDSAQRLDYASGILKSHQIYLAGTAPRIEEEHTRR